MFSEDIREYIKSEQRLWPLVDLAVPRIFVKNAVMVYQIITASENLLRFAATYAKGSLRDYYIHHLEEERGHEKWLAEDLKAMGVEIDRIELDPIIIEMPGVIYYMIAHRDPSALLGYMAVLEGNPVPLPVVEALEQAHGKDVVRTLRYHAENDIHHSEDLWKILDGELSREQRKAVWDAVDYTTNKARILMERIV